MNKDILINASNLHTGGGVQVAVSFIYELCRLKKDSYSIICSTVVYENLKNLNLDDYFLKKIIVIDIFGFKKNKFFNTSVKYHHTCFTIFGPFYHNIQCKVHICGFAQPWIAYPNNDAYKLLSLPKKIITKLKYKIQKLYFKKYDLLIVEQQHVKNALINIGFDKSIIRVVPNTISSLYENQSLWKKIKLPNFTESHPILGFIGRPYLHKNIKILKDVNIYLQIKYNLTCNFLFTFTKNEMDNLKFTNIPNFYSIGSIQVSECPSFYECIDFLIFPSLLECFSASPLEAKKMGTTIIASNYSFIREVCEDNAFYFDAMSYTSIGDKIFEVISNFKVNNNKHHSKPNAYTAEDRAKAYINIIESVTK